MLKDISAMNPKGHVKLELYNEEGVFYTKERKNLVVQSANEIVAHMMADPAKVLRVSQVDKGDSALTANSASLYPYALTVQAEVKSRFENNWGTSNTLTEFQLEELQHITSLDSVTLNGVPLEINTDVFLKDSETGKIQFTVAPTENIVINFHKVKNPYMRVIDGTEKVTVNGDVWDKAGVANTVNKTYQVNYRTGEVLFEASVQDVVVEYDYHMNYSLGFMSLGGKPTAAHPNYQPVEFGNTNKLDTFMRNELANSRMAVHYPAGISYGATELEPAIPTQPIASVQKTVSINLVDVGDSVTKELVYDLPNTHDSGSGLTGRSLLELVSIENITTGSSILTNTAVDTNTLSSVRIAFDDGDVSIGDNIEVVYRLKLDNRHLIYQLGQSPVVKLVSVRHIDAVDNTKINQYNLVDDGLRASQGDVWISNPNTGHITFNSNPTGGPQVHTPGQIQVEYMVNSGTVVKFIADFPKGVPAPSVEDAPTKVVNVSAGQSSIALDYPIAKDALGLFVEPVVKVDSVDLTSGDYTISLDGRTITPNSLSQGQVVSVDYKYEKATHDIYQVAMFDGKVGGKMFNISGIGPVTKDKNTGMRVTWSITF